jgi:hypothetical protein
LAGFGFFLPDGAGFVLVSTATVNGFLMAIGMMKAPGFVFSTFSMSAPFAGRRQFTITLHMTNFFKSKTSPHVNEKVLKHGGGLITWF